MSINVAKANLLDALQLLLECRRELAERDLSPESFKASLDLALA